MSETSEQIAIFKAVKAMWTEYVFGPLQYPNTASPTPAGKNTPRSTVTLSHTQGARKKLGLGKGERYRSPGLLVFTIHIPNEAGTLVGRRITDAIKAVFDEKYIETEDGEPIQFQEVTFQDLGSKSDTYRISAICGFTRQEGT